MSNRPFRIETATHKHFSKSNLSTMLMPIAFDIAISPHSQTPNKCATIVKCKMPNAITGVIWYVWNKSILLNWFFKSAISVCTFRSFSNCIETQLPWKWNPFSASFNQQLQFYKCVEHLEIFFSISKKKKKECQWIEYKVSVSRSIT